MPALVASPAVGARGHPVIPATSDVLELDRGPRCSCSARPRHRSCSAATSATGSCRCTSRERCARTDYALAKLAALTIAVLFILLVPAAHPVGRARSCSTTDVVGRATATRPRACHGRARVVARHRLRRRGLCPGDRLRHPAPGLRHRRRSSRRSSSRRSSRPSSSGSVRRCRRSGSSCSTSASLLDGTNALVLRRAPDRPARARSGCLGRDARRDGGRSSASARPSRSSGATSGSRRERRAPSPAGGVPAWRPGRVRERPLDADGRRRARGRLALVRQRRRGQRHQRSRSAPGSPACSARTAPASRPSCTCSPGSSQPSAGQRRWSAASRPGATRRSTAGSGSCPSARRSTRS